MEEFKVVYRGGEQEIIEKKSRFIATVFPIESEKEALETIEQMRKKYWNATHNCFAYVVGRNQELQRFSDDGEPSGTAGKPILDVLLGEGIHNALIIVTRYFGGTLLGTGGLVRAYSKSAKAGLEASAVLNKISGKKLLLHMDYNSVGKIQYILAQNEIAILDSVYAEEVDMYIVVANTEIDRLNKLIIEATSAKVQAQELEDVYFGILDSELLVFGQAGTSIQ